MLKLWKQRRKRSSGFILQKKSRNWEACNSEQFQAPPGLGQAGTAACLSLQGQRLHGHPAAGALFLHPLPELDGATATAFMLRCGRRLLRTPRTERRAQQSVLKETNAEYSLEGLTLKVKLQHFGHLMWKADSMEKDSDAGKDWRQEEKGATEDEMVGWHYRLEGHGFGWTLGVDDGQGGLACCSSWGHKESDTTKRLNWTDWNGRDSKFSLGVQVRCTPGFWE